MRVFSCICGQQLQAGEGDFERVVRAHAAEKHTDFPIVDDWLAEARVAWQRAEPWDGRVVRVEGTIDTRPLRPPDAGRFIDYFDRRGFADNPFWASCYCYFPHVSKDEWPSRSASQNREDKAQLIREGKAHGYFAYSGDQAVGWCHAAPRDSLLMVSERFGPAPDSAGVGSIVCFVVAAPYRGQGVAGALLEAACAGFGQRGLVVAEAYPAASSDRTSDAHAFWGPRAMYEACGFSVHLQAEDHVVMRKAL